MVDRDGSSSARDAELTAKTVNKGVNDELA